MRVTRSCISALLVVIAYLVFVHVLDFQVYQDGCQGASQLHWQCAENMEQLALLEVDQRARIIDDYAAHAATGPRSPCSTAWSETPSIFAARMLEIIPSASAL